MKRRIRHCKGQFIVAAAMFIALIILSMSIMIYSTGSRYQTLEKEPVREIVQTITDDFKRMLTIALADYSTGTIKDEDEFREAVSNWVSRTIYCYSGMGLQLKVNVDNLMYQSSSGSLQIGVTATLNMNITNLGFYNYSYPAHVSLNVGSLSIKAPPPEYQSGTNYVLKDLNITLQANKEDNLPASDLTITGLSIKMYYETAIELEGSSGAKDFTGDKISVSLDVKDANIIIAHVMTRDGVSVKSITSGDGRNYILAYAYSSSGYPRVETWYLLNPSTGTYSTHTVNIGMSSSTTGGVVCVFGLKNVYTDNPIGSTVGGYGKSNNPSISITTQSNNSWIVSIIGVDANIDIPSGKGQVKIWSFRSSSPEYSSNGTWERMPTAGLDTQSWSLTKNPKWTAASVEIKAKQSQTDPLAIPLSKIEVDYYSGEGRYVIVLKEPFDTGLSNSNHVYKYEIVVEFQDSRGISGELKFTFNC